MSQVTMQRHEVQVMELGLKDDMQTNHLMVNLCERLHY